MYVWSRPMFSVFFYILFIYFSISFNFFYKWTVHINEHVVYVYIIIDIYTHM